MAFTKSSFSKSSSRQNGESLFALVLTAFIAKNRQILPHHLESQKINSSPFLRVIIILALAPSAWVMADDPTKKQIEFFEKKIRPVLSENCFECHSDKKQESDLRLDSRDAILSGGASGPAADVDDPGSSLILEVLEYGGDVEMPPDQKLDDEIIDDIRKWIKMGLPWPKKKSPKSAEVPKTMAQRIESHREKHWAFQPRLRYAHPKISEDSWSLNRIDKLVLAKLNSNDLTASPEASRQTLIRRLYLTILGVPPTYLEVNKALNDQSPDWYEKLVDRLLMSPRYGERWGRHWLDVARYADTKGYSFQKDRNYPHAYTFRDYVISAWNDDKPFDRFVQEQLAADYLELGDDLRPLAGLGFLTVGRKFNNVHDDIDDKIDVVFRGLQGLTVACARCHDHKYDAIPTEDYYSLYGVFASGREGNLPYIGTRQEVAEFKNRKSKYQVLEKKLNEFLNQKRNEIVDTARSNLSLYFASVLGFDAKDSKTELYGNSTPAVRLVPKIARAWRDYIRKQATDQHPFWSPWKTLATLKDDDRFAAQAKTIIENWKKSKKKINPLLLAEFEKNPLQKKIDLAQAYGKVMQSVYQAWKKAGSNDRGLAKLSGPQRQAAIGLFTNRTPTEIQTPKIVSYLSDDDQKAYKSLKNSVEDEKSKLPPELDRAMVVSDIANPIRPVVFIRGQAGRRGKAVPRQFIEILSKDKRHAYSKGAGRFEMAKQITNPENPLTSRVLVNRIWMQLMGKSLVATPSDFGTRCPEPVQRDVLDYLANELIENDWSIKSVQRLILTSATFRQSSKHRQTTYEKDSENELFWRYNRQRLDFEPLRDSMLFVSGELDLEMGGKSVEITKRPFAKRRAVYGYIDRQDLPNLLRAFDFASPDQSSAKRTETTVPQQVLFLMNSPFVMQRAHVIASRLSARLSADSATGEKIRQLHQWILSRDPSPKESKIFSDYIEREANNSNRWRNLAHLLLQTNEFTFVD